MTVLFHFSLSLSNYEQRRATSIGQGRNSAQQPTAAVDQAEQGDGESTHLLANVQTRRRRDYLKSPLLYQNAFL